MSENLGAYPPHLDSGADRSSQVPHSKEAQQLQQSFPQGRRVTIGGMNRRSSLGMAEAILGDTFGRRASGFGELDVLGRRGSMDSTSAVLDAAIMDLTRRRLSMAMGSMPPNEAGGMGDPLASMNAMGGLGGMDLNMGAMNPMSMNMNMNMNMNMGGQLASPLANQAVVPAMMPTARDSVNAMNMNARQNQLQEQQRDLERRQKELEMQRQQLVSAMEERRRVMQQMQQKMQMPANPQLQRNSHTSLGGNQALLMGLQNGLQNPSLAAASQANNARTPWHVCTVCNSKAFANREEAMQHETICVLDKGGRSSIGNARRSSLDLLVGTLDRPEVARHSLTSGTHHHAKQQENQRREPDSGLDRRFSLSGDNSGNDHRPATMSNGPFSLIGTPIPLAMAPDKDWLTPLHCFVRRQCVEVFTATEKDVATPSKGKRKPIQVGQVGIRCPHCHHDESAKARERGSVYYPTSIASIYNATMNLLQRHLHNCSSVPRDIMRRYETLKADDARSGTSKKYWVESALSLGLVDTPNGIRCSALAPPPLPSVSRQQVSTGTFSTARRNSNDFFSSNSNAISDLSQRSSGGNADQMDGNMTRHAQQHAHSAAAMATMNGRHQVGSSIPDTEQSLAQSAPLVTPDDEPYATGFSYHLLSQMQPCVFTEADRLGKRKGLPPGFPGLACRHCFGGYGSGRFFPSSIKTLSDTSKTLNVLHNHMMRCRKCPVEVRETLDKLRRHHDEERAKMKFGSQKAFFARIWDRLHYKDPTVNAKRKFQPSLAPGVASGGGMAQSSFHHGGVMNSTLQQNGVMESVAMQYSGDLMDMAKRRKM